MTLHDDLPSLYRYTRWADGILLDAARKLSPDDYAKEPAPGWASVRSSLVHMGGAMRIWRLRLEGEPVAKRPEEADFPEVEDAAALFLEGHDAFDRLVEALTPEKAETLWTYRDLKGDPRTIPYWSVYRHVANHQTYHRGQVVSKLKRFGVDVPFTDFVYWVAETLKPTDAG